MKSGFIFQVRFGLTVFDCHIFNEHRHAGKEINLYYYQTANYLTSHTA